MIESSCELVSIEEISEMLKIGRGRVYELLNNGKICAFRIGSTWKVPKESIDIYIRKEAGLWEKNRKSFDGGKKCEIR